MKKLHYKDVVLANPVYSDIRSRDDVNTEVFINNIKFNSCMIPSNMKCAISFEKALELSRNGYFYILHRFYPYEEILKWIENNPNDLISISVGVKQKDYEFVDQLAERGISPEFITIDIAYGHSILMKEMLTYIKNKLPNSFIIAGNVCTPEAISDLEEWGASAIKIGIAGGFACRTYNSTGVGSPMFSTIRDCAQIATVPLIADGGIRDNGDICKALVAGATLVMSGTKFVECRDSPAPRCVLHDGSFKKEYFGSASSRNKGHDKYSEGSDCVLLNQRDRTYFDYYGLVDQGIRSCMSYHNVRNIKDIIQIKWFEHNSEFDQNLDRYDSKDH